MEELISKVNILKELEESIRYSMEQSKEDGNSLMLALKDLIKWAEVKKQIRLLTLERPILSIPDYVAEDTRKILQKINLDEKLPLENFFSDQDWEIVLKTELEEFEIENLESDLFYSWFSGYDYVKRLYSVGSLVVSVGALPDSLSKFVDELRLCYVFYRYLAVYAICRAILDIATLDIFNKNGLDNKSSINYRQVKRSIEEAEKNFRNGKRFKFPEKYPNLYQKIKMLTNINSYKHLEVTLNDIRKKTNPLAHGNINNHVSKPLEIIKITLQSIHDLYEIAVQA